MTWAHKARGSEGGEPDETGFPREGYALGDLAGAVSLSIPMEVYEAEARERTMANVSLFGALAAVIVAVAVAVNGALRRQGRQMDTLDAASLEADRYRVEILPSMCSTWRMRWRRPLRLTVALTAAGVVAKKILPPGVTFDTRIAEIGGCTDPEGFDEVLRAAAAEQDSVGGIIECRVQGVPLGLGQPFFDSAESMIAHLLFSVPAVKGVEFGSGFAGARMRGSENNDPFLDVEGTTATNNAGGINGGLTNGNELVVRAAVKPTPSIGREQMTYNLATNKVEPLTIRGRHDVCVALRGAVVVEAAVAIALANFIR